MYHFIILKIKKTIIPTFFVLFTIFLVIFSKENMIACKNGLTLWANNVVPSLLPFFIATELLSHTNIVSFLGKFLNKLMRPIFNVPGEGAFPFIMGIISGYPIGAKIVTDFREKNICTKEESERLIAFTNNSGPLFIIGTVGISLFLDTRTGILLFITHLLACISVGICFRFWKKNSYYSNNKKTMFNINKKTVSFSNLGEILSNSITNAIFTVVMIGGFVVLFSVVLSILERIQFFNTFYKLFLPIFNQLNLNPSFIEPTLTGLLELTNGVKNVSLVLTKNISVNIIICSFLLGFGGISVLLQVFSIISKTDISIKAYALGKLLQGTFAALYTYIALKYTSFFNLDLQPVFMYESNNIVSNYNNLPVFILGFIFVLLIMKFIIKKLFVGRRGRRPQDRRPMVAPTFCKKFH